MKRMAIVALVALVVMLMVMVGGARGEGWLDSPLESPLDPIQRIQGAVPGTQTVVEQVPVMALLPEAGEDLVDLTVRWIVALVQGFCDILVRWPGG